MTRPARSTVPRRRPTPTRRPKPRSVPPRARTAAAATLTLALALTTTACAGTCAALSAAVKGNSADPGCIAALSAVSEYGPRAVTDLAQGRVDVNKAVVHLMVLGGVGECLKARIR